MDIGNGNVLAYLSFLVVLRGVLQKPLAVY